MVDSNVWVQLYHGGLFEEACRLPYELVSPDAVVAELDDPEEGTTVGPDVQAAHLDAAGVERIAVLAARYRRPSPADLAALVLAERMECILITGDSALRKAAEREGVEAHGVLWVLDRLVGLRIIPARKAALGLRAMLARGARIPGPECEKRLRTWSRA